MKIKYDLHIHSALSPCAEEEMTPNNIVNMAVLNGLDAIAVTDHNSTGNVRAVEECARSKSVVVVPGMEVESTEEVHICCLFPNVESAESMSDFVSKNLKSIKNQPNVLGRQQLLDSMDRCVGEEEQMLLFASSLTIEEIFSKVEELGGCGFFAHVDRSSYSVLSVLGAFPEKEPGNVVEVTGSPEGRGFASQRDEIKGRRLLFSSDSHRLADMNRGEDEIEIDIRGDTLTAKDIVDWIKGNRMR
ncbi:MAG: PHP domain-containing protein [Clostridiales bacterium]|nr:PHP domain-containing protein [Clostridiales bacterium]